MNLPEPTRPFLRTVLRYLFWRDRQTGHAGTPCRSPGATARLLRPGFRFLPAGGAFLRHCHAGAAHRLGGRHHWRHAACAAHDHQRRFFRQANENRYVNTVLSEEIAAYDVEMTSVQMTQAGETLYIALTLRLQRPVSIVVNHGCHAPGPAHPTHVHGHAHACYLYPNCYRYPGPGADPAQHRQEPRPAPATGRPVHRQTGPRRLRQRAV